MAEMLDFLFKINALYSGAEQIQQASASLTQLQQKTQSLQKVSSNISGFQKQAQKLSDLRSKLDTARAKVRDMQTVMRQGGQVDPKLFTRAHQEAAKLQEQVIQNTKRLGEFRAELKNAGIDTSDLAGAQAKLQAQTDAMTRAQERLTAAQNKYSSLKNSLSWNNIKSSVVQPLLPVVATLKPAVKLAADFESAMARVKSVGFIEEGSDMAQFEAMRNQALKLGADTKFTAIEAAGAQENLIRAGMSPQDVINAVPAVLDMASAEGMDLASASSIIAKGLGGMNLEGQYAGRLADILAYTSGNTNTNIAMIGEAFKVAAPVASSQGITMEQLASYIGAMANKGYEGGEAGNTIAAAMLRLAKMPKEGQQVLKSLGVATMTREGKMRELPDTMAALSEAMAKRNYGEAQQLNVIETLFGKNFGKAMMGFMQASAQGDTDKLQAGVYNNSFGRAKAMSDINLDTLNGQIAILGSAWDGVRTTIGEMFSPLIRDGVELLSNALSRLNELMKSFPNVSKAVVFALGGLAGIKAAKGIWDVGSALLRLPGAWLEVAKASGAASAAMGETPGMISRVIGAFGALKAVILAHPLLTIAAVVAAVVAAVIMNWDKVKAWWQNWVIPNIWEPVREKAAVVWNWLKENWKIVLASLFGPVGHVVRLIIEHWDELKAWWQNWVIPNVWEPVREACEGAYKWISGKCQELADWWNSWTLPDVWATLTTSLDNAIAYVKGQWQALMDWLGKFNPFNWEMPSWLGGGKGGDNQVKNAEAVNSGWMPAPVRHAVGGILTQPHVGLVAEAGPEAIIPLRDKSRGIPLLLEAAGMLGVGMNGAWGTQEVQSMGGREGLSVSTLFSKMMSLQGGQNAVNVSSGGQNINVTVNVEGVGDRDEESLASKIADKVREVLGEVMSLEERVSYA